MPTPQQETFTNVQPLPVAETFSNVVPIPPQGASAEEQQFLQENPNYKWMAADPKFPNRPQGIYPSGPGNEWRKDPSFAQSPVDLHLAKHTYEGAKAGAMAATAPLALEATLPQLAGGVVGGAVGSFAGEKAAKAAGSGEFGQEVAGDLGSLAGGALAGYAAGAAGKVASSKARAIYEALPESLQKLVRAAAPTKLKLAVDFWDGLNEWGTRAKPQPELDATGENKPFAGSPAPKPARWDAFDATGENKPFAGGMDEWMPKPMRPPSVVVAQPTPAAIPARMSPPGSAGSLVRSVTETPPAKPDPLLTRLRAIAADIEAHDKTAAAAKPEDDLTGLLLDSLKPENLAAIRAKKAAATVQGN
jgi:hypothetical protein